MTYKKLIEDLEKEIEKINLEHGTHTGIKAEDCSEDSCVDRDKINQLKREILKIKQARQITLKEESEFLKSLHHSEKNTPKEVADDIGRRVEQRIKKIKEELR